MTNKQTIGSAEVAQLLDVSASYVRKLATEGSFGARKEGGRWIFDAANIDAEYQRRLAAKQERLAEIETTTSSAHTDWTQLEVNALRSELAETKIKTLEAENERLKAENTRLRSAVQALAATTDEPAF